LEAAYLVRETDQGNKSVFYAAENETPTKAAFHVEADPRCVIDSGATSHCTGNRDIFDNLTPCGGKPAIAGGPRKIVGRGNVITRLQNSSTARLAGVLLVPDIRINLLSTTALLAQGIENHQLVEGVSFYRKGEREVAAKGAHKGKMSYLTWVRK
jgi:hypothetical protein